MVFLCVTYSEKAITTVLQCAITTKIRLHTHFLTSDTPLAWGGVGPSSPPDLTITAPGYSLNSFTTQILGAHLLPTFGQEMSGDKRDLRAMRDSFVLGLASVPFVVWRGFVVRV